MISVVKFLRKEGIVSKTERTVDHQRGATGLYDALDMLILSVVGIVGGARSIRSIVTVWNDRVLSRAAGWPRIPDETTFGRILRTFTEKNIKSFFLKKPVKEWGETQSKYSIAGFRYHWIMA